MNEEGVPAGLDGELAQAIAALLDSKVRPGLPTVDPVRLRHIEAMARRTEQHSGEVRVLLQQRLRELVAAAAVAAPGVATPMAARPRPLADLLAHVNPQATVAPPVPSAPRTHVAAPKTPPAPPARIELKAVREHRQTWSRLRVDQRLRQSRSRVPQQAGPLNTHKLLHQTLTALLDASPAYLNRLMSQVEAVLALEQAVWPGGVSPGLGNVTSSSANRRATVAPTEPKRPPGSSR